MNILNIHIRHFLPYRIALWLFIFSFSLMGCVKNNPIPAYLEITSWKLESNPVLNGKEGELFHGFRHAAIYVGGEIYGYFELPCKVPILKFGEQPITISPVIMDGGRMSAKVIYPFVESYEQTLNIQSGETYTLHPVTKYNNNVIFDYEEDFESASLKIQSDPTSLASLQQVVQNTPGKSGYKGEVHLTKTDSTWLGVSFAKMVLPGAGRPVYMEIDFRTQANVSTGMIAYGIDDSKTINPNVRLNAQSGAEWKWTKIYIDLTEIASYIPNVQYFEYYLSSVLPEDREEATIELDNIKIIHY